MSCWAVVALKASAAAKGRLAEALSADERARLARLMFDNVIDALRHAETIGDIAVVTPESLAIEAEVTLLQDPGGDLNDAFAYAAELLTQRGARELLVLPADLPFVSGAEIDELVRLGRLGGLAIAPDKLGEGTNALFVTLPTPFRFLFGVNSCALHLAEAADLGLAVQRVDLPGLAFDVDEPQDLVRLRQQDGEKYGFLEQPSPTQIVMNLLMNRESILQALQARVPNLLAIYAFGSRAQGSAGPQSDLDLAVLVAGYAEPLVLWELAGDLADLAGCPVDLLDLRAASTVMQYQVITGGQRWWARDAQAALFEAAILSEKTALDSARAGLLGDIQKEGKIYGR